MNGKEQPSAGRFRPTLWAILCGFGLTLVLLYALVCAWGENPLLPELDLVSPPDKLVYTAGESTELDLAGAMVRRLNKGGEPIGDALPLSRYSGMVSHDADFTVPGSYIVEVRFADKQGKDHKFWFTITVEEP